MGREILKGDIYWARLDKGMGVEQSGTRPVLIISLSSFNISSQSAIALAITSQKPRASYPLVHELSPNPLPKPSWVKMAQVRTLSTERLGDFMGRIDAAQLKVILDGFRRLF